MLIRWRLDGKNIMLVAGDEPVAADALPSESTQADPVQSLDGQALTTSTSSSPALSHQVHKFFRLTLAPAVVNTMLAEHVGVINKSKNDF